MGRPRRARYWRRTSALSRSRDVSSQAVTDERVLVVNAGSTSLKLSVVARDGSIQAIDSIDGAPDDVLGVAHRVVHGGARFREPVIIDDAVEDELRALAELAPLHNRR